MIFKFNTRVDKDTRCSKRSPKPLQLLHMATLTFATVDVKVHSSTVRDRSSLNVIEGVEGGRLRKTIRPN